MCALVTGVQTCALPICLAERLARTQRASQAQTQSVDPVQAALQRVRAQKVVNADAALKKAKVDLAMSRAQLNKSLQAFGHPPTFEQQSQLIVQIGRAVV